MCNGGKAETAHLFQSDLILCIYDTNWIMTPCLHFLLSKQAHRVPFGHKMFLSREIRAWESSCELRRVCISKFSVLYHFPMEDESGVAMAAA